MLVPFDSLPDGARIWIYQADRKMSEDEIGTILPKLEEFLTQWTAHGANLKAAFQMRYQRFIVIALDESQAAASGCSIDASVHFIQGLEQQMGLSLLDKLNVTYYNGPHIAHKSLSDFKKMAKNKSVSKNTIVFNNLVNTKGEFEEYWEVPAKDSWHARFLA
ncbi:ABC transporter ATPase [Gilvibacter sp.]|uniref:ABC transporter ATPase n=1 Tax=Gilvibacter sp. TaxID=2729997 RepID=UPI003F4A5EFB